MLLCFVFVLCLVFPMLPVSLECPFLIASLVFSKVCFTSQHGIKNVDTHSGALEG